MQRLKTNQVKSKCPLFANISLQKRKVAGPDFNGPIVDLLPLWWVFGLYLGDCILQARKGYKGRLSWLIQETASGLFASPLI